MDEPVSFEPIRVVRREYPPLEMPRIDRWSRVGIWVGVGLAAFDAVALVWVVILFGRG